MTGVLKRPDNIMADVDDSGKKNKERGFKVSEIDPDKLIYKDRDCKCIIT